MCFVEMVAFCAGLSLIFGPRDALGHKVPTHQFIAFEAVHVWTEAPQELKDHVNGLLIGSAQTEEWNVVCQQLAELGSGQCAKYDQGDEVVVASGEEDGEVIQDRRNGRLVPAFSEHFWNPDVATADGDLDVGVSFRTPAVAGNTCLSYGGAFRRAEQLYERAKTLYRSGDKAQAYYWLGRVAHLVADMAVPAHVHNDLHPGIAGVILEKCGGAVVSGEGDDAYEDFMGRDENISRFIIAKGKLLKGNEYHPDALANISIDFDWSQVSAQISAVFKLFWYTAQKTQYFGSDGDLDDREFSRGDNGMFRRRDGSMGLFFPSLWYKELPVRQIIADPRTIESDLGEENVRALRRIADALIPHALKAVAGLYRLFWLEVHTVTVMDDEFDDNSLDPARWRVEDPPVVGSQGTVAEVSQRLEMSMPAGAGGAGVVSQCFLSGDFDVRTDFVLLSWPADNRHSIQLRAPDLGLGPFGSPGPGRFSGPQELYTMVFLEHFDQIVTGDMAGSLRMQRVGSTLRGYSHNGTDWQLIAQGIGPGSPTRIALEFGSNEVAAPAGASVAFDNFVVTAGAVECPPGGAFDADGDGLVDAWERHYWGETSVVNDPNGDFDGDRLTNLQEFERGTNPTLTDTDGDAFSDGQEVAAGTDPLNASSRPSPAPPAGLITLAQNLTAPVGLALDQTHVYWLAVSNAPGSFLHVITKLPVQGGTAIELASVGSAEFPTDLEVDTNAAYWSATPGFGIGTIHRVPLGGGAPTAVAGGNQPSDIATDGEFVYWAECNGGPDSTQGIRRAPANGGEAETLTLLGVSCALDIDSTHIYFGYFDFFDGARIGKISKAGGEVTVLALAGGSAQSVVATGGEVYWADSNGGAIRKVSTTGGPVTTLATGLNMPTRIAVDGTNVYWTENAGGVAGAGAVRRVPVSGGQVVPLATGLNSPYAIRVGGGALYWTELGTAAGGDGAVKRLSPLVISSTDLDLDGVPDDWELIHWGTLSAVNDANADFDGDGLSNLEEVSRGTFPTVADTDGDGVPDGQEVLAGSDPLDANSTPASTLVNLSASPGYSDWQRFTQVAVVGSNVYTVWRDSSLDGGEIAFRRSTDGGFSWQPTQVIRNSIEAIDPVVAASGSNVFVLWDETGRTFLRRSGDAGQTFGTPQDLGIAPSNRVYLRLLAEGMNVYVVWLQPILFAGAEIVLRRSFDGGVTWDPPLDQPPRVVSAGGAYEAGVGVAVSGLNVYVAWTGLVSGQNVVLLRRSQDGGLTFDPVQVLAVGASIPELAVSGGNVYVFATAYSGAINDSDIVFRHSTDGGSTWDPPLDQSPTNLSGNPGCSQLSVVGPRPSMVAVRGSSIVVVWLDGGTSGCGGLKDVLVRRSLDGGVTWDPSLGQSARSLSAQIYSYEPPQVAFVGNELVVVWEEWASGSGPVEILLRRSPDGGVSWEAPVDVSGSAGNSSLPRLAVGASDIYAGWVNYGGSVDVFLRRIGVSP